MKKVFKHLWVIIKHKYYVFCACRDLGITWRGIKHDLSKFSLKEFMPSVRYFQGNGSPIDAEKIALGYSAAWQHHKGRNSHHWEYWLDTKQGSVIALPIPKDDLLELLADWIGAGKAYNKSKWTQETPYNYYQTNMAKMILNPSTRAAIEFYLVTIKSWGWEYFVRSLKSTTPIRH